MPTLVIQTTSGALAPPGTSLHQMPCHASPAIDPQIFTTLENMPLSTKPTITSQVTNDERDQNNNNNSDTKGTSPMKVTKLNATWTHKYVSPDFKIHGENFDQHLHNLLMPSERRIVKRAMETYDTNKNMDNLLLSINSVLDNPHKWPVWYFIVQSLKGKDRGTCRRKLAELLQSQTSDTSHISKQDFSGGTSTNEGMSCQDNSKETANTRSKIRRRRTMRASYNREQCDDMNERSVVDSNKIEPAASPSPDRDTFRVRRPRRRRTVSGIDLSKSYETTHNPSDILRIEEPDEIETHLPADVDTEPVFSQNENTVGNGFHTTGRSLRRRRRDPMLRRLQSAESVHAQEISMERDALTARNSMPFVTTPEEQHTGSLRARRRRSFRRSLDGTNTLSTKDPIGCHERAALIVRRRSEQAWTEKPQETHIDSYIRPGATQSEETTRSRRRRTAANHQYSNRTVVPETSIDDYILSENGNNNNANSLYIDEDSLEQTTDEQEQEDSDMSLKSPLSMKGLRASFRIKSSKNKDLTELKVADTSHGSSNDEKSKSKKSGKPGLLERMGMGKKHQSSSDSSNKDESKSKKLFGKKSSKKDSSSEAKSSKSSKSTNNNSKSPEPVPTKAHQKDILNITQTPSPTINDSFFMGNDSPVLENGFFGRNSKKRLTFSRPPKNSDTEAFLTELSAQFDDDLNILDDLAKALQQQADASAHPNFGSKWTYLPGLGERGGKEILQSSNTNDMSDLNLSDIEDNKKDETPPFPLILDSGDESGLGTMDAITPPPQPHYAYRDRELEWERERQNRKKKRRQAFESLTSQSDDRVKTTPSAQNNSISQSQPAVNVYQDDEKIYDIPKTTTATTTTTKTRTRGNRRARRGAMANRSESVPAETSYPPNTRFTRRHAGMELDNVQTSQRNVSEEYIAMLQAAEQNSQNQLDKEKDDVFEKPKRRAFRNPDSVFSASDESVHSENDTVDAPFPVDRKDSQSSSDFAGEVGQKTSNSANGPGDNYVYVDDENVYAAPRSANSTAVRLRKRSHEYPPHSILNGDLSFTDINSLLQESDDEDQPQATLFPNANGIPPPPPPPPGVPPPPPPPPNPSMVGYQQGPASPTRMNVKRLNWQKIEPPDLKETVWGQIGEDYDTINDVVKYLDLEQHFATKKARELKRLSLPVKSSAVSILTHKKAYNTSILLAHLRMTVSQLRGVLLSNNDQRMDTSQYKQMLMYAPDDDEATKLLVYHGDVTKLNEADQFARKMVTIPGYRLRLQALMYKQGFEDREKDVRINLEHIQQASIELRKSKKLAKILEFVLAMGNYMNRGHTRISKATGFKIQFLADMDSTKTSDNKLTFLHILARAVYSKFPELCNFSQDLKDVRPASRVVYPIVFQELQDMRSEWVEIRDRMPEALTKQVRGDRFKQAMENFLVMSNGALKSLEMLLAATMKEFHKTARYFGENAKNVSMQQFFSIFGEFIAKFEKADHEIKLIMQNKSTEITS
uniref:uncharacterized protein LOC120332437 n=1 Tax=Styela clava TaxID=7725 RepID=UPI0019395451|nr:uncharacterized protein LOC120332437 [Styela clava]XP_039255614.1 uncharacterized protein LOC120332437 [Styela clava]